MSSAQSLFRGARPASVLEAEGEVVLDPLHDELAIGVLPDHPDPGRHRRRLESPDLDLDEALKLFEEGVEGVRAMRERLAGAEATVKQVLRTEDLDQ